MIIYSNEQFTPTNPGSIDGCISYYKLNEGSGAFFYDSVGSAIGSMFDTTWGEGRFNSGLSNALSGYAKIGSPHPYYNNGSSDFTISCWINPKPMQDYFIRILEPGQIGNSYPYVLRLQSGVGLRATLAKYDGTLNPGAVTDYVIPYNKWTHLAGKYHNGSRLLYVYIDGTLKATTTDTTNLGSMSPNYASVIIGNTTGRDRTYVGNIDEISLFNRALSDNEISRLYQNGSVNNKYLSNTNKIINICSQDSLTGINPGSIANCKAYFKFEEGTGSFTYDSMNTFNGGSLQGGTSFVNGRVGSYGANFDGSNDSVLVYPSNGFDSRNTDEITIMAWIKRDTTSGGTSTYTGLFGRNGAYNPWGMIMENSFLINFSVFTGTSDPGDRYSLNSTSTIPAGSWTHVAASYNRTTGSMSIYFNGSRNAVNSKTPSDLYDITSSPLRIGGNRTSTSFKGQMDEVCLFDRCLGQSEIQAIYGFGSINGRYFKRDTNQLNLLNSNTSISVRGELS